MASIRITDIKKTYDTKNQFLLTIKELCIREGEFFVLVGPSGCGKTTLLRLIAGLLEPDLGGIEINGQTVVGIPAERRGLGMVFQHALLFPHMNVEQNVAFGLKMQGMPKKERLKKAREILYQVELTGFESRIPTELSGGQQQRVSLARALVTHPRVLLLDEPFSALDPELRNGMRQLVKRMQREYKVTVVMVTHDREEAFVLGDRIGVMKEGTILQVGTPAELYKQTNHPDVAQFLGIRNILKGKRTGKWFLADGLKLELPTEDTDQEGWLVLRPEVLSATLHQDPNDSVNEGIMTGVLSQITYVGSVTLLEVQMGGHTLEVMNLGHEPDPSWVPGRAVTIRYRKSGLHFIPLR
ncbi:ABC transporter ATP-binding protein [Ammoniphilus sp. CFH 90114]|uniref:ABC transporter ATP-binding protein n=1 Tax=Ammoniphilus sp. CFH 90114 TaxID=2493665 RepID=UPI0013E92951|nr:ABC transporter ATP-binding protein [Ammoniphilus sp. CFH 90114]